MDNLALYGHDMFGDVIKPPASGVVAERFTMPPFTILDAKSGAWQDRKRAWINIGIESDIGRGDDLTYGSGLGIKNQTSIFDPVLCELMYKWFNKKGGQIVDPFAGGSVRGIVAGMLGMKYWGCDLRQCQIAENKKQANKIQPEVMPEWICGDSMETLGNHAPDADFLFSCPPYGDLEVYSDNANDLSNMEWHTFIAAYNRIILKSVTRMKPDTFACFVVGDFRDKKGFYRNFVSQTIEAFELCGAKLYNEAILATSVGSASMRVTKQFDSGRKMAKTHQNVLVFCRGDWKKAANKCIGV